MLRRRIRKEGGGEMLKASRPAMSTTPVEGLRRERCSYIPARARAQSPYFRCRLLTRLARRVRGCVPMPVGKTERQRYGLMATVGCWTTPRGVRKLGALIQPADVISARKSSERSFARSREANGPKRRAAPLSMSRSCEAWRRSGSRAGLSRAMPSLRDPPLSIREE